jgi:signal transduction histidine kinase
MSTFSKSHTSMLLLKINEALLLAKDEQEILASVALCVSPDAVLRLLYLQRESDKTDVCGIRIPASWKDGCVWEDDPFIGRDERQTDAILERLLDDAGHLQDYVWLIPDLRTLYTGPITTFSTNVHSVAVVKLYRTDPVDGYLWDAAICATWEYVHEFDDEERYLLAIVSQTVSAVVSNRKLYLQAVENLEKLKEVDRLKTQFLYTVSHELRTPLTGIITIADTLLHGAGGDLAAELRNDISWILSSGNHLLDLINDILDLAKIEAGRVDLHPENIVVPNLIQEVVHDGKLLGAQKALNIEQYVDADVTTVWADRKALYQVLLNLVSNAVKFTDTGTVQIRVSVDGDVILFAVQDEGIGIPAEYQDMIFRPFQQADSATRRKIEGTGLGLAISKRLIELHNGRIWLTSAPEKGSTFFVALPRG